MEGYIEDYPDWFKPYRTRDEVKKIDPKDLVR